MRKNTKFIPGTRIVDIREQRFERLVVKEYLGKDKWKKSLWKCVCDCGNICVKTKSDFADAHSCGCLKVETNVKKWFKGCGNLGLDQYNNIRRGAEVRNIEFSVSIEYLWELFQSQGGVCALSGRKIHISPSKRKARITASVDRIDARKGYTPDNVQWVHKQVNVCKHVLNNYDFIAMCREIASYQTNKIPFCEGLDNAILVVNDHRKRFPSSRIVCVSGSFDPLHVGHIEYLKSSRSFGDYLVAIVNGDSHSIRKKGYCFFEANHRREIVASLKFTDLAFVWESDYDDVSEPLRRLRPNTFCNGGDRSDPSTWHPKEVAICQEMGIMLEGGVGGTEKIESSSALAERFIKNYVTHNS